MHPFLSGITATMLYIIIAAGAVFSARVFIRIPDELFRKILHFVLLGVYFPVIFAFEAWWMAVVFAVLLIVIFFPVLALFEKLPMFSSFVNERKHGEFKSSLVLAMGMMACSITVCWGLLDDKLLVLACIYAWGVGDAFAALIGKPFGKHKIRWRFADGKKSVEGSCAMFLCPAVSVLMVLLARGGIGIPLCLGISVLTAVVCTFAELCSKNGLDTVICPTAAMAVILPMVTFCGG